MVKGAAGRGCRWLSPWQQRHTGEQRRSLQVRRGGGRRSRDPAGLSDVQLFSVGCSFKGSPPPTPTWTTPSRCVSLSRTSASTPTAPSWSTRYLPQSSGGLPGLLGGTNSAALVLQLCSSQDSVRCSSVSTRDSVTYSNAVLTKRSQSHSGDAPLPPAQMNNRSLAP